MFLLEIFKLKMQPILGYTFFSESSTATDDMVAIWFMKLFAFFNEILAVFLNYDCVIRDVGC